MISFENFGLLKKPENTFGDGQGDTFVAADDLECFSGRCVRELVSAAGVHERVPLAVGKIGGLGFGAADSNEVGGIGEVLDHESLLPLVLDQLHEIGEWAFDRGRNDKCVAA